MTNNNASSDNPFIASYTERDTILYALAVGFGDSRGTYERDLRFLWESHEEFTICPTFCLTLIFWAQQQRPQLQPSLSLPHFPPPLLRHTGVLPTCFLKSYYPTDDCAVLHTFQSITWWSDLRIPKRGEVKTARLFSNVVSVRPKSIGTFVTTERRIEQGHGAVICSCVSTELVLGVPPDKVIPYTSNDDPAIANGQTWESLQDEGCVVYETVVDIHTNAALLYRISSGDTNDIHVDPKLVPSILRNKQSATGQSLPLLHGLCTLGIVTRVLMQQEGVLSLRHIEATFRKPVMVGDSLTIQFCKSSNSKEIRFRVKNSRTSGAVVENGYAILRTNSDTAIANCRTLSKL